ncbi:hypothetical protein PGT21_007754 [Puccinia graminis f. sp. tritici]|uniref:Uncharacterized protein n=1 Tax=Puccinia graminis f. sp. tritici TaxID=56615 RepID=A0A5B0NRT7_PUCGR|nr:hypothetical protein PGTUg99_026536 [Puccinia graminis f. sp. tritici]KAA1090629.1 hypothetical protein PGT21_007754 [Puccinia graminis f. sp. tritici]
MNHNTSSSSSGNNSGHPMNLPAGSIRASQPTHLASGIHHAAYSGHNPHSTDRSRGQDFSVTQGQSGTQVPYGSGQIDPSSAHPRQIPAGRDPPGAMFANYPREQLMDYSSHQPMVYSGPPHMGYPAAINYGTTATPFHHSAPAYTIHPHHPYLAPPHSQLAPMHPPVPQYYHHPSFHMYPPQHAPISFAHNAHPNYWPLETNSQNPAVNYGSHPGRAVTSHPSHMAYAPHESINVGFQSNRTYESRQEPSDHPVQFGPRPVQLEIPHGPGEITTQDPAPLKRSNSQHPAAYERSNSDQRNLVDPVGDWENACWDLGDPTANFQEV